MISARPPRSVSVALALFGWLSSLLPSAYLDRHRESALALTEQLLLDAHKASGGVGVICVAVRCAFDLIVRLPAEYLRVGAVGGDLLFAFRSMRRRPLATVMAVATIAVGVGANAAVFSIVDWVLLRPLPYPEPGQLVRVFSAGVSPVTPPAALTSSEFSRVAAWSSLRVSAAFSTTTRIATASGADAFHAVVARTAGDLFGVLGSAPLLGRFLTKEESYVSTAPVAVISERTWRSRLFSDPHVVGRVLRVDGQPVTIVGVVAAGRGMPSDADLWRPMTADERNDDDRELTVISRVADVKDIGRTDLAVGAAGTATARRLFPESLHKTQVRGFRASLLLLWASASVVLAMVCASVAALVGARASDRAGEFAVRAAIGADRARLLQQLVTESLLLSLVGGAAGLWVGSWTLRALVAAAPSALPRATEIALDWRVTAAGIAVTTIAGLVIGSATAAQAFRRDAVRTLGDVRGTYTARGSARRFAVIVQMATAVVLAVTAAVFGRALRDRLLVENGFDADRLIAVELSLRRMTLDEAGTYRTLIAAAESVPGVQQAAVALREPQQLASVRTLVRVEGATISAAVVLRPVTAGYFDVAGIRLLHGRRFNGADRRGAPRVAIVNATFARRFAQPVNMVGQRFTSDVFDAPLSIVGVAADVTPAGEPDRSAVYVSFDQISTGAGSLIVRTIGDPRAVLSALAPRLRQAVPAMAFDRVHRVAEPLEAGRSIVRFNTQLASAFAGIVVLLAVLSVYGLTAGQVTDRARELAIRVALGSSRSRALWTVLLPGVRSLAAGAMAGVVAASATSRVIGSRIDGVGRASALTVMTVALALLAVGGAAALLAALQAERRDPAQTLRAG